MGRPKNYENMTHEERMEYHTKQREQEAMVREALLFQLRDKYPSMIENVEALVKVASSIGEDLQWHGIEAVSCQDMHKLIDSAHAVTRLYHLDKDESDE
tara:strand:+ start:31 stop:327 length:297 start_codon:yes stop_codon:yes gene_type:complete